MEWPLSGRQALVASSIAVLGQIPCIIYINDIDLNNFISKFAGDTKIGNAVLPEGDRRSLQEDLRKTSAWSAKQNKHVPDSAGWI